MSRTRTTSGRPPASGPGHRAVLAVVCLGLATVVSAVSALNVAIPSIARETAAPQTQLSWIIDAYALTFAALLLPFGALGDRLGRRRTLVAGLVVFAAAAAMAMTTSSPEALVALRGLLGAGAALVMPATLSTITATFPDDERLKGVAVWTGVAGASAVLGLLASGLLLEAWSWQSVFGLNVGMALVALAGTLRVVPESRHDGHVGLDPVGSLLSVGAFAAVVYGLIEAPHQGWASAATLGCLGGGLALLVLFLLWEAHTAHPLLDPRLFARPAFAAGTLSVLVQFTAFFGFVFVFLQYLQLVRGWSPLEAALGMVPLALGIMPGSRVAPRVAAHVGRVRVSGLGLLLLTGGLALLWRADLTTSYGVLAVSIWLGGLGMGLAMTPATTAITDALPREQQGVASAVNDLARELGGAIGIAVLGSLLNDGYRSAVAGAGLPHEVAARAQESVAGALQLGPEAAAAARTAFVAGQQDALLLAAASVAGAGVVVVGLLHRASRSARPELSAAAQAHRP
ncbi:MFS transporter [Nocardioides sp. J54]|uniref:MFS transporter n=1 Tax=Nocardioides sp. J54 TaxID=935866 RepID=UPI0004B6E9DD|nr:MFS transporter [Nocardioides sp. J54]